VNTVFVAGFSFFVVAMALIAALAVRWAIRQDRRARAARMDRAIELGDHDTEPPEPSDPTAATAQQDTPPHQLPDGSQR